MSRLLRDVHGKQITCEWFSRALSTPVIRFEAMGDAFETNQSSGTKVLITQGDGIERILFLKKVVGAEFPDKPLHALRRDLLSNRNEARFYTEFAADLTQRGVPICAAFHIEAKSHEDMANEADIRTSAYLFLLASVEGAACVLWRWFSLSHRF